MENCFGQNLKLSMGQNLTTIKCIHQTSFWDDIDLIKYERDSLTLDVVPSSLPLPEFEVSLMPKMYKKKKKQKTLRKRRLSN